MTSDFPIRIPDKLPSKVENCPIVSASMEMRFTTNEPWSNLPGLLVSQIRKHYPLQMLLPLAQMPEEIRHQQPQLTYQPLIQFQGNEFSLQFGPRVIALSTLPNAYPGWTKISQEMQWLLEQLKKADFIQEGERLGVRYIDFFEENLFPQLLLQASIEDKPLLSSELLMTVGLKKPPLTARLQVSNGTIALVKGERKAGSVLDLDVWLGASDFDVFTNGMAGFESAHTLVKQIFFGLLKPSFLTKLKPTYS